MLMVVTGLASCTGTATTTDGSEGPATTTTTTTTTVTHRTYAGVFKPVPDVKYIDLKTREQVVVRIDTEKGEIVNAVTNETVYLFVEPTTHDTIYGLTGNVVNNYVIRNEAGEYKVDTVRINSSSTNTTTDAPTGNYKEKIKGDKHVIKTDDYKIKEKNGEIKKIKEK